MLKTLYCSCGQYPNTWTKTLSRLHRT